MQFFSPNVRPFRPELSGRSLDYFPGVAAIMVSVSVWFAPLQRMLPLFPVRVGCLPPDPTRRLVLFCCFFYRGLWSLISFYYFGRTLYTISGLPVFRVARFPTTIRSPPPPSSGLGLSNMSPPDSFCRSIPFSLIDRFVFPPQFHPSILLDLFSSSSVVVFVFAVHLACEWMARVITFPFFVRPF